MAAWLRFLRALPKDLAKAVIVHLPGTSGVALRRWYYTPRLGACGTGLRIDAGVQLRGLPNIFLGNDVHLRENVIIQTGTPPAPSQEAREVRFVGRHKREHEGRVEIGDHSRIAFSAIILGYGGVKIGEKCGVGPNCVIVSESLHHKGADASRVWKYSAGAPPEEQCVVRGRVLLEDGAGVASNVTLLPGARVGRDAWVGVNSVVSVGGAVPADVVAKGDPAVPVFRRPYATSADPAS
jgi:acetyltransferase-like isoleucine patch superfamily enzyme